MQYSNNMISE